MRKIAIDAMGGDRAPASTVLGAVTAAQNSEGRFEIVLVGDENVVKSELGRYKSDSLNISVMHAPEIIGMSESPTEALRKKVNSSISVLTRLLKNGEVDGIVSAGNTGAYTASCLLTVRKIEGVKRPTIGTFIPCENGSRFLLDVGANPDCRPIHLLQSAIMGSIFIEYMLKRKDPRVGLLNIGEESSKGNELSIETYKLLKESSLNFVGNIEGRDILKGIADVIVCDGFVGNIILKYTESFFCVFEEKLKTKAGRNFLSKLGLFILSPILEKIMKEFDYQEYGGVPLLGINGVAIICHGDSSPKAIMNAVERAYLMIERKVNEHIRERITE
ncbi:phosphate acyltransferase PlsX [candidate division KSB1 bacterium]